MTSLRKQLRKAGYDLIDGPVRNHKPLQLWLKPLFKQAELYYSDLNHAFDSPVTLVEEFDPALTVDSTKKDEYGFNVGITVLEEILKSLGLGAFELSSKVKSGKKVTISYDHSVTKILPIGNVEDYFFKADFRHPNTTLLKNANRNKILVITGVVLAQDLNVEIETDFDLDISLQAELNTMVDGKVVFDIDSNRKLKMVSKSNNFFPIAVKANRIDFDKGAFSKLKLVTDKINDIF